MKLLLLMVAVLIVITGCAESSDKATLRVLAAASLTESFSELETTFEAQHPDVDVVLTFDSSALLVEQLRQGIPGDVLATADEHTMTKAEAAGVVAEDPTVFATNTLTIVTPPGNPANIHGLDDLAGSTFAVCVPAAPCGEAAQRLLSLDDISSTPATEEENVKGVLTKVITGEVDAGLVYQSDASAAGDAVETVKAKRADEVVNSDFIAMVNGTASVDLAADWIELVTSEAGQRILASYGFGPRG